MALPPATVVFVPNFLCSSADNLKNNLCLASFDARGVRILSIHCKHTHQNNCSTCATIIDNTLYSGSLLTTSSSRKPSTCTTL